MKYSIKHVSYFLWTIVNLSNYFNVCNLWKLGIFLISKYDLKVRHDWVTEEQQHQKIWFNLMWPLIYNKNSKIIISLISIFWHFLLKIYAHIYIYIYIQHDYFQLEIVIWLGFLIEPKTGADHEIRGLWESNIHWSMLVRVSHS